MELNEQGNLAETLAREMKQPVHLEITNNLHGIRRVALPPGWKIEETDDEKRFDYPRRKTAKVVLHDAPSFISYVKRHGSLSDSTIWCNADYLKGSVSFTSILNDHGADEDQPAWRDHTAKFSPTFSEEWNRWSASNSKAFNQADFAGFIEDNLQDIASDDGFPTGAQMLEMAINFEARQDMRFKSAIRLQSGGVQMNFVQDDDKQTVEKMNLFERFRIGIPVFWNGDAYPVVARLRYRVREGKLTFWYELVRQDKVLEAATMTMIQAVKAESGMPFFFGSPF